MTDQIPDPVQGLCRAMSEARSHNRVLHARISLIWAALEEKNAGDARRLDALLPQLDRLDGDLTYWLERLESKSDAGRWFLKLERED